MFSSLSSGILVYIPCTEGIDQVRLAALLSEVGSLEMYRIE